MLNQRPLHLWAAVSTSGSAPLTQVGITWVEEIWDVLWTVRPSHRTLCSHGADRMASPTEIPPKILQTPAARRVLHGVFLQGVWQFVVLI